MITLDQVQKLEKKVRTYIKIRISENLELTQFDIDGNLKLNELTVLSENEKKQALLHFNNTDADYPVGKTIHRFLL